MKNTRLIIIKSKLMYLFTNAYYIVKVRLLSCAIIYSKMVNKSGLLLDLGSGASPYNNLYHSDVDIVTLEYNADRKPNVVADAHFLPFKEASFDYITSFEVLEHVKDPNKVVSEINRVLKDSGTCAISVPMTW